MDVKCHSFPFQLLTLFCFLQTARLDYVDTLCYKGVDTWRLFVGSFPPLIRETDWYETACLAVQPLVHYVLFHPYVSWESCLHDVSQLHPGVRSHWGAAQHWHRLLLLVFQSLCESMLRWMGLLNGSWVALLREQKSHPLSCLHSNWCLLMSDLHWVRVSSLVLSP